jgi:hypothetical protein
MNNLILFIISVCMLGIFLHNNVIVKETFITTMNRHINRHKRKLRLHKQNIHNTYIKPIHHLIKKNLFR